VAQRHGVSESVLLRRLIDDALVTAGESVPDELNQGMPQPPEKISVRLRPDDLQLLQERAIARKIRPSTYAGLLLRAHLRNLTPLPTEELLALKRSIAEVGAVGRNLNQIARALHQGEGARGPDVAYLQGLLKILTGLRDHTKAIVTANSLSWEARHEQKSR